MKRKEPIIVIQAYDDNSWIGVVLFFIVVLFILLLDVIGWLMVFGATFVIVRWIYRYFRYGIRPFDPPQ